MMEGGIDQKYLARKLALSVPCLSGRFTSKSPWKQDEMYLTMDILIIPHKEMHKYFPPNGEERS